MGFLSDLFKKGEAPDTPCANEVLGSMKWSEEDEAWLGEFNSARFSLAYEGMKQPSAMLVTYAREVLNDRQWLASSLADAKGRAKRQYGDFYFSEIDSLSIGRIHFYIHKGQRRIIAELDGGKDDRLWRIEYADRDCEGIGFDR